MMPSSSLRVAATLALLLPAALPAAAQSVDWRTRATFYGDNTEFFTPFRTGETILGAQFSTYLDIVPSEHTRIHAGVRDLRYGDDEFLIPSSRFSRSATRRHPPWACWACSRR